MIQPSGGAVKEETLAATRAREQAKTKGLRVARGQGAC
jgi:hypothetical protein